VIVEHLPDGRTIADTSAMAALTGRPVHAIRRHCPREPRGYDADHCLTVLLAQPDPVVLTAAQADRYLAIPAGTIYSWVSRGQLAPLDRVGGRPVYDVADLTRLRGESAP
jgi:hypothetical protein